MWDLSSPTGDRTCTPSIGRQSLNHWTTREVPVAVFETVHVLICFQSLIYKHKILKAKKKIMRGNTVNF